MADVFMIGDPFGVEGFIASQEDVDDPEVSLGGGGPPVMSMKEK